MLNNVSNIYNGYNNNYSNNNIFNNIYTINRNLSINHDEHNTWNYAMTFYSNSNNSVHYQSQIY